MSRGWPLSNPPLLSTHTSVVEAVGYKGQRWGYVAKLRELLLSFQKTRKSLNLDHSKLAVARFRTFLESRSYTIGNYTGHAISTKLSCHSNFIHTCTCTYVYIRGATDDILHFPPMDCKVCHQIPRIEVPQLHCEVSPTGHEVV